MKYIYLENQQVYLDACATTPPHESVIRKTADIQSNCWGNPSSLHQIGIKSATSLEGSRNIFSTKLSSSLNDIVFTSGATESINIAIFNICSLVNPGRIVISEVEHPAVMKAVKRLKTYGWNISFWPVDEFGIIRIDMIEEMLAPPTKFVSLIWGQSEIGTIQPITMIGNECRSRNIIFHTDATQILPHGLFKWTDLPIDMLSASAHKMQGPKGVGLLLLKSDHLSDLTSLKKTSFYERNIRPGTQSVPLVAGFAESLLLLTDYISINDNGYIKFNDNSLSKHTNVLGSMLEENNCFTKTGHSKYRLPNHLSFILSNNSNYPINARKFVKELSRSGIYISSGTACQSGINQDSYVLTSIGIEKEFRQSGIRISLGPWIKESQLEYVKKTFFESIIQFNKINL